MNDITPEYTVSLLKEHCETHTVIGGLWTLETIQSYFDEVDQASMPLVKERLPIYAYVDFSKFVPQDRETGDAIRDHLLKAQKFGLKRVAIVGASALTTMQYKRLSQGVDVGFFDEKFAALTWLRKDR